MNSWHTPSPWRVVGRGNGVAAPETEDALALNVRIIGGNTRVNMANARLIAAAPELLEALQAIIGACDRCGKDDDKSLVDEFTEEMEQAARSAIDKATGRVA